MRKYVYLPLSDAFTAPLEPDVNYPSRSDLEGSAAVLDGIYVSVCDSCWCSTLFIIGGPTKRALASRMLVLFFLRVLSLPRTRRARAKTRGEKVPPMCSTDASPSESPPDSLLPSTTIPHEHQDYYELVRRLFSLLPAACDRLESDAVLVIDAGPFSSVSFSDVWRGSSQGLPVAVKSLWCYSPRNLIPLRSGL